MVVAVVAVEEEKAWVGEGETIDRKVNGGVHMTEELT